MTVLVDIKARGACRGLPDEIFFPPYDSDSANATAKAVCATCPVRAECLDWAMQYDEVGVWGGTGEADRRSLDRKRERKQCPLCSGVDVLRVPDMKFQVCLDCGTSWPV